MIFTIGYQRLTLMRLTQIAAGLGARVIDCRAVPRSRKPGFSSSALRGALGVHGYLWHGNVLGGYGSTSDEGIRLVERLSAESPVILMCMEAAPGECHRHHDICAPYFPHALHIFDDELIEAGELQRSIDDDDDYELAGSLAERLHTDAA